MGRGMSKIYTALELPRIDFKSKFQLDKLNFIMHFDFFQYLLPRFGVFYGEGDAQKLYSS